MPESHLLTLAFVHASTDVTDAISTKLGLFVVIANDVDDFEYALTAPL